MQTLKFIKATLFKVAFFLTLAATANPQNPTIQSARSLVLEGQMQKALKFLNQEIKKQGANTKKGEALISELQLLARTFLTQEGQKTYSQAIVLIEKQPNQALKVFADAAELEPANTKIIKDWANAALRVGEIDKALELALKGLELDPYDNTLMLNQIAAHTLDGDPEKAAGAARKYFGDKPAQWPMDLKVFGCQWSYQRKDFSEVMNCPDRLSVGDKISPYIRYWQIKAATELGLEAGEYVLAYLTACENEQTSLPTLYPWLQCQARNEVKKSHTEQSP